MGPLTPASRARGFTLVEILVVVAIVAIAAGLVSLSLAPDEHGLVLREARRFGGAIEYATARAQMRGETLGVSAAGPAWRFWTRAPGNAGWVPLAGDDALAPRALPPPVVALPLAYAGRAIAADAIVPLRASGRNEPFAFELGTARYRATLSSDVLNRVRIDAAERVE